MNPLRTPDDRFQLLPDFEHTPGYALVPDGEGGQIRMAYVEVGPTSLTRLEIIRTPDTWNGCGPSRSTSSTCVESPSSARTGAG